MKKLFCHRCEKNVLPIQKLGGKICSKCRTLLREIWFTYEDPNIYDGYCAIVYKDGTFELRDHWAVNRLTPEQRAKLSKEILDRIALLRKEENVAQI